MTSITRTEIELLIQAVEQSFSITNRIGQFTKRSQLEVLLGKLYNQYVTILNSSKIIIPFSGRVLKIKKYNNNLFNQETSLKYFTLKKRNLIQTL